MNRQFSILDILTGTGPSTTHIHLRNCDALVKMIQGEMQDEVKIATWLESLNREKKQFLENFELTGSMADNEVVAPVPSKSGWQPLVLLLIVIVSTLTAFKILLFVLTSPLILMGATGLSIYHLEKLALFCRPTSHNNPELIKLLCS